MVLALGPAPAEAQGAGAGTAAAGEAADTELPPALRRAPPEMPGVAHEEPTDPMALRVEVGAGGSLRLVQNHDFAQDRFAPSYLALRGAFQWHQRGRLRHGVGLGVEGNLSGDGSFQVGLDPFEQWVVTPLYVLEVRFDDDPVPLFDLAATVGVPLSVSPEFAPGLELSATFTARVLAGLGAYVSVGASAFLGGDSRAGDLTIHPLLSAELGLAARYELLP